PLQRFGVCRASVSFLQNGAPGSPPHLLAPRRTHACACLRRDARLPAHPVSGVVLEPLRRHRGRRPPRPDDALPRRSIATACPELSRHSHPACLHCAIIAERRQQAPKGLLPLWDACVHEEKTPIRTPCAGNAAT